MLLLSPLPMTSWQLERGATVIPGKGVQFAVWAPFADCVRVRLTSDGVASERELTAHDDGVFQAIVAEASVGAEYGYLLGDSDRALPDPVSRWQPEGVHGASRVVDPSTFRWSADEWRGVAMRDLVIYELHVGTFTRDGTFSAVIPHLRGLRRALGVNAIEIMPVAQFSGTRNWGYDGVDLYAVQNSYGGPDGLKQLVNAAHAEDLAVILDVVYNHIGPEGNYLPCYGPYFTEKYKTPWGPALNYDDAGSDEVRRYVVDNARYWIAEYHLDGLRLDAVHGIFDFSAKNLMQEIGEAVHELGAQLGRRVVVIAESDLNDPKLIRSTEEFGYGLDAQWSDDFHHAVHALLTNEKEGYYADFGAIDHLVAALREPFVYDGAHSSYRRRRHGGKSEGLPRERFVVAIQNHDQVGNRAKGDRLATLLSPEQLRLAAALLLLSPYVPLIFMGEEYGETNPFQYFVSHGDPGLVEAVRGGRRREFESFGWGDDMPDPQDEETLRRSVLDRSRVSRPENAALFALYRDLLTLRDEEPMLRPDGAELTVTERNGCITMLRTSRRENGGALLAFFNCTDGPSEVDLPDGRWSLRLTTDARFAWSVEREAWSDSRGAWSAERGASGVATAGEPRRLLESRLEHKVSLPPWCAALFSLAPNL